MQRCYPPTSSNGDFGAAPSGLHLSVCSKLLWVLLSEESSEGAAAPPALGGAVTPFLFTMFRKAVLPIFWRWRVKAASTWQLLQTLSVIIEAVLLETALQPSVGLPFSSGLQLLGVFLQASSGAESFLRL